MSPKIDIRRFTQISESHCGPAVIQMLLHNIGVEVSQEEITQAAGAVRTINDRGTRIDQLAKAVVKLAPHARFWYKENGELENLRTMLRDYNYPVGVEWQGLFNEHDGDDDDPDYGHYSVVTLLDDERKELIIVDPYKDFTSQDRIVSTSLFVRRWWDINEVTHPITKRKRIIRDTRLFFIIAPRIVSFPPELGMKADIFEYEEKLFDGR